LLPGFSLFTLGGGACCVHGYIFDGGPIAEARVAMLRTVGAALNVELRGDAGVEGEACLVANMESAGFRATLAHSKLLDDTLQMMCPAIQLLGRTEGARACAVRVNFGRPRNDE